MSSCLLVIIKLCYSRHAFVAFICSRGGRFYGPRWYVDIGNVRNEMNIFFITLANNEKNTLTYHAYPFSTTDSVEGTKKHPRPQLPSNKCARQILHTCPHFLHHSDAFAILLWFCVRMPILVESLSLFSRKIFSSLMLPSNKWNCIPLVFVIINNFKEDIIQW